MQGLPSMSRWSLLIFRSHVQRSRSNHSFEPSVLSTLLILILLAPCLLAFFASTEKINMNFAPWTEYMFLKHFLLYQKPDNCLDVKLTLTFHISDFPLGTEITLCPQPLSWKFMGAVSLDEATQNEDTTQILKPFTGKSDVCIWYFFERNIQQCTTTREIEKMLHFSSPEPKAWVSFSGCPS